jgi:hypothetical protein
MGEPSGTTCVDDAGSFDLTYYNTPTLGAAGLLAGDANTAVTFVAASSQYARNTSGAPAGSTVGVTLECWVSFDTTNTTQTLISWGNIEATVNHARLEVQGDSQLYYYWSDGVSNRSVWVFANSTFATDVTHHFVVVHNYAAETVTFYQNGELVETVDVSAYAVPAAIPSNVGGGMALAVYTGNLLNRVDGTLDEVAIYDVVLSAAQVANHYNVGLSSGFGTPTLTNTSPTLTISPSAIASAETFGTATLLKGGVTVAPSAIASTEAVSSPVVRAIRTVLPSAIPPPINYQGIILADSPAGYWRLGEPSGTAADNLGSGGAANDGTYVGSPTLGAAGAIAGDADTAMGPLDAATQYVSIPVDAALNVGDVFTLEAWVSRGSLGVDHRAIFSGNTNAGYLRITDTGYLQLVKCDIADIVLSTSTVPTGWHHVAATKNGADVHLYIDGADVTGTVTNATCASNGSPRHIGSTGGSSEFSNGTLDEVAVYGTALTADRILAHYAAGLGGGGFGALTLAKPRTISPSAIESTEAFGSAVVSQPAGALTILPTAIATAEALGTATILRGGVSVLPISIASAEAFGTTVIVRGTARILPTAIATSEAFGTATITRGGVIVQPTAIATAEVFGTTVILRGGRIVQPTAIASAEAFGTAVITRGGVIIQPTAIVTSEAFGTATILRGGVLVLPTAISSAEALGAVFITMGGLAIQPSAIGTAESFGTATILRGGVIIQPTAIASAAAIGSTIVASSAVVVPTAIASAQTLGTPSLAVGGVAVQPSAISSAEAFGAVFISMGGKAVQPAGITSVEAFGTAIIRTGNVNVVVTGIATGQAFGTATLLKTKIILVTGIASAEAFGSQSVSRGGVSIVPTGITTGEAPGTPGIGLGGGIIVVGGITSAQAFGNPTVTISTIPTKYVIPQGMDSGEVFGLPVVRAGLVRAIVSGIGTQEVVPNPALYSNRDVIVTGITSQELFGLPILAVGSAYIRPIGIVSQEFVGIPLFPNLFVGWRWVNPSSGFTDTRDGGFPEVQTELAGTVRAEGE